MKPHVLTFSTSWQRQVITCCTCAVKSRKKCHVSGCRRQAGDVCCLRCLMLCLLHEVYCNYAGYVLAGHVISKSQVPTRIDCAFECLSSLRCVSYNYEEGNRELHDCELNSEKKDCKCANLTGKAGYSYYGTRRNVSNSCPYREILLNATFIILSLDLSNQPSRPAGGCWWPWQQR